MKRLGIIGGQGPETSAMFCINVNRRFRELTDCQADIVLENMPISKASERRIIMGGKDEDSLHLMKKATARLEEHVDFLVIPCNSAHVFLDRLRKRSKKPILSIIEETANVCQEKKFKKIGLLASSRTIQHKLHEKALQEKDIFLILPKQQKKISQILINIVQNKETKEDKKVLLTSIEEMRQQGAEAIILGCTDLQLFMKKEETSLPLIDTLAVLENATVKELVS